jgi:bifunctional N-acetylglucosamine-1-phosphate-uridyltransferase/glucosamine-1-phosphate-acetyltransferase GlmU-like protein
MKYCGVIPAAGRGSRLGIDVPKILAPVGKTATIWSILKDKLKPFVEEIHVVVSPAGKPFFDQALAGDADRAMISTGIQPLPRGMGDAIFGGADVWGKAQAILVIWGDQVHVSAETIAASLALHGGAQKRMVIPVVALDEPYVEYVFDRNGRLTDILQSREGDICRPGGFGDVGTFVLSTKGLKEIWDAYVAEAAVGASTGEQNFLPFLVHLSQIGWDVRRHPVSDPWEARGINTPEDLAFFQKIYEGQTVYAGQKVSAEKAQE